MIGSPRPIAARGESKRQASSPGAVHGDDDITQSGDADVTATIGDAGVAAARDSIVTVGDSEEQVAFGGDIFDVTRRGKAGNVAFASKSVAS